MNENYKNFIDALDSSSMKSVARHTKIIGEFDFTEVSEEKVINVIIATKPKNPGAIIRNCYIFNLYAKFLGNEELSKIIYNLDKKELWNKAKEHAPKKFISNSDFNDIYHDIATFEDFNGLYQQTLLRCIYEGIYNEDLSVIKNLKKSDIHGNIITLREDNGHVYDFQVTDELAKNLRELGDIDIWERRNGRGVCKIKTYGDFPDTCFKLERRNSGRDEAYRYNYYRLIRKLGNDYAGYKLLPFDIFASGIMHRVKNQLAKHNITLTEAFTIYSKDILVHNLIEKELLRCNYDKVVSNFRMIVKGHLEVFDE